MYFKSKTFKNDEIRPAIEKLTEMGLTLVSTPELKELFIMIKNYLNSDERADVFISLPKSKQIIRGELEVELGKNTWIKLEHL